MSSTLQNNQTSGQSNGANCFAFRRRRRLESKFIMKAGTEHRALAEQESKQRLPNQQRLCRLMLTEWCSGMPPNSSSSLVYFSVLQSMPGSLASSLLLLYSPAVVCDREIRAPERGRAPGHKVGVSEITCCTVANLWRARGQSSGIETKRL